VSDITCAHRSRHMFADRDVWTRSVDRQGTDVLEGWPTPKWRARRRPLAAPTQPPLGGAAAQLPADGVERLREEVLPRVRLLHIGDCDADRLDSDAARREAEVWESTLPALP
jgi:hypothetical protein